MGEFRILIMSDPHFAARADVVHLVDARGGFTDFHGLRQWLVHDIVGLTSYDSDLADSAAAFAYEEGDNLDLILITGDLATTGRVRDLERARDFVQAPATTGWLSDADEPSLQGADVPVAILPGNHDRLHKPPLYSVGGRQFDRTFADMWSVGRGGAQLLVTLRDPLSGDRLTLLAADLTLTENAHAWPPAVPWRWGQGRAYREAIERLERATEVYHRQGNAVMWALHFPPECSRASSATTLLDGERVIEAAERAGVENIVAGHVHQKDCYDRGGAVTVHCAGSTCRAACPRGNYVHVFEIDTISTQVARVDTIHFSYSEERGHFVREG